MSPVADHPRFVHHTTMQWIALILYVSTPQHNSYSLLFLLFSSFLFFPSILTTAIHGIRMNRTDTFSVAELPGGEYRDVPVS